MCLCVQYVQCLIFQVQSKKKTIKRDLPIQIGFFVYQYAKLRMLDFFYNVIDRYMDRSDYEMLEMDTGNFIVFPRYYIRHNITSL